jgi:dihydrofolate reductase
VGTTQAGLVTHVRKIIESTLVSVDGVIGNPQIWADMYFDDEAAALALDQLVVSDAMLMGRRTYEIFSRAWPEASGAYAERMNNIRKYVFSSTLKQADWPNSVIISGDVATEARKLRDEEGRDLVMYGHGPLGQTLMEHRLLDELNFWIHPLFVGGNTPLFRQGETTRLDLTGTKTLRTGVVILSYRLADA